MKEPYLRGLLLLLVTAAMLVCLPGMAMSPVASSGDEMNTLQTDLEEVFSFEEEAAAYLRQGLIARQEEITLTLLSDADDPESIMERLWELALAHDKTPKGGDYLAAALLCSWECCWRGYADGHQKGYVFSFSVRYRTTAEQEAQVDAAVEALLNELDLGNATEYQKIRAVYDWICANVSYGAPYDVDDADEIKHTAYSAIIYRSAVCSGYAKLCYRLMLELGVDARYITGDTDLGYHAWNIVKLDGKYYYLDTTWDAGRLDWASEYKWFLKSDEDFLGHYPDCQFVTEAFLSQYIIHDTSYGVICIRHQYTSEVMPVTCTEQGCVTYTCVVCGDVYSEMFGEVLGHIPVRDGAVTPTCTEDGLREGSHCAVCGEILKPQEMLPATEHFYWPEFISPTCTEGGYTMYTCTHCGDSYVEDMVPADGHVVVREQAVVPTCTQIGWTEGSYCSVCEEVFAVQVWIPATGHSFEIQVTAPTCQQEGYTSYICRECGFGFDTDYVDLSEHNLGPWQEVFEPTCTVAGYRQRECRDCYYYEMEDLPPSGHDYGQWYTVFAPGADYDGLEERVCQSCDDTCYRMIPHPGHVHDYYAKVAWPTCTEDGYTVYACDCGESYVVDPVPAEGHAYTAEIVAPTCTEPGYTIYLCYCGDSYNSDPADPLGHDMDDWYWLEEPGCTEPGYRARVCANCGRTETEAAQAVGHEYTSAVVAPTCEAKGYTIYLCRCGASYMTDVVDPLGHDLCDWYWLVEPDCTDRGLRERACLNCDLVKQERTDVAEHICHTQIVAPTCTERGYTIYTCDCGYSYAADAVEAVGHDWGEWNWIQRQTCTNMGYRKQECRNCHWAQQEAVAATGHSYVSTVTVPTCTTRGYTAYLCACGDCYFAQFVAALGHERIDGRCIRCEVLTVLLGDVNGDGKVNARDARLLLRYVAGLAGEEMLVLPAADYNGDGKINARDARLILRHIAGLP